jgi:ubiquinone biosynthesis protein COQ9
VRRGAALLALPSYAAEGARAVWQTADTIWNLCGDTATDYNWYTKRMILSSVHSATLLYWLGDPSPGYANTWAFLDRRIEDVMRFEKTKAQLSTNPLVRAAMWGPMQVLNRMRAPGTRPGDETGAA